MRLFYLFFYGLLLLCRVDSLAISMEPQATALLQGVGNERLKYDCFEMRYEESRREEGRSVVQVIKFDHGKIRKEHLPNETFRGSMSIYTDDVVYVKTSYDSKSVELAPYNLSLASGADIYDPRLFGLTDTPNLQTSLDVCLGYSEGRDISVQQTVLDGKRVYLVTEKQDDTTWEFYVEEPGFRLLKKIVRDDVIYIQIDNEYSNPDFFPFPTKVNILRKERNKIRFDRTITITNLEKRESFPPETFTLASLNLPLNAMVTDYRISQMVGYWDGEKLVENPVHMTAQELRELENIHKPRSQFYAFRWAMMTLGVVCVIFAIIVKFVFAKSREKACKKMNIEQP